MDVLKVTRIAASQSDFDASKRKGALNMLSTKDSKKFSQELAKTLKSIYKRDQLIADMDMTLKCIEKWDTELLGFLDDGETEKVREKAEQIFSYIIAFRDMYGREL